MTVQEIATDLDSHGVQPSTELLTSDRCPRCGSDDWWHGKNNRRLCRPCQREGKARRREKETRACRMPGCPNPYSHRGLCATHGERQRRHGDPTIVLKGGAPKRPPPPDLCRKCKGQDWYWTSTGRRFCRTCRDARRLRRAAAIPERACRVADCPYPVRWVVEMLCNRHELMMRRTGDPLGSHRRPKPPKPPCRVPICGTISWQLSGYCRKHLEAYRRYGDPLIRKRGGVPKGFPMPGPPPKGDVLGYDAAHRRVARVRGKARNFTCVDCGVPAQEWSYNGGNPDELLTDPSIRKEHPGLRYSLDPTFYRPRCIRCHRLFDASLDALARGRVAGRQRRTA